MADEGTQVEDTRPLMPVEVLVDQVNEPLDGTWSESYPGTFAVRWNPDSRELVLAHDAGEYSDHRSTEHVFRLGAQARVGGPSLGEAAWGGYLAACGGEPLVSGVPLPTWDGMTPEMCAAWEAAADAVRRAC